MPCLIVDGRAYSRVKLLRNCTNSATPTAGLDADDGASAGDRRQWVRREPSDRASPPRRGHGHGTRRRAAGRREFRRCPLPAGRCQGSGRPGQGIRRWRRDYRLPPFGGGGRRPLPGRSPPMWSRSTCSARLTCSGKPGPSRGAKVVVASTSEVYGKNPATPWQEDADRVLRQHIRGGSLVLFHQQGASRASHLCLHPAVRACGRRLSGISTFTVRGSAPHTSSAGACTGPCTGVSA